jgi:hypothetical protein
LYRSLNRGEFVCQRLQQNRVARPQHELKQALAFSYPEIEMLMICQDGAPRNEREHMSLSRQRSLARLAMDKSPFD